MELVTKQCQQPRLNLKNSPPFILDILPSISRLLTQIFCQNPDAFNDDEYLKVFVKNLIKKCGEVCIYNFYDYCKRIISDSKIT